MSAAPSPAAAALSGVASPSAAGAAASADGCASCAGAGSGAGAGCGSFGASFCRWVLTCAAVQQHSVYQTSVLLPVGKDQIQSDMLEHASHTLAAIVVMQYTWHLLAEGLHLVLEEVEADLVRQQHLILQHPPAKWCTFSKQAWQVWARCDGPEFTANTLRMHALCSRRKGLS